MKVPNKVRFPTSGPGFASLSSRLPFSRLNSRNDFRQSRSWDSRTPYLRVLTVLNVICNLMLSTYYLRLLNNCRYPLVYVFVLFWPMFLEHWFWLKVNRSCKFWCILFWVLSYLSKWDFLEYDDHFFAAQNSMSFLETLKAAAAGPPPPESNNNSTFPRWQHFTRRFLIQKCYTQIFCTYTLPKYFLLTGNMLKSSS